MRFPVQYSDRGQVVEPPTLTLGEWALVLDALQRFWAPRGYGDSRTRALDLAVRTKVQLEASDVVSPGTRT
jgi:hypothetical protein